MGSPGRLESPSTTVVGSLGHLEYFKNKNTLVTKDYIKFNSQIGIACCDTLDCKVIYCIEKADLIDSLKLC